MKLRPTQVVGLVALVVFGGVMIWRLNQPSEKEVMEERISALADAQLQERMANPPVIEFPTPDPTVPAIPAMPATPLQPAPTEPEIDFAALGPQGARDDLYCAGVLRAHFQPTLDARQVDRAAKIFELSRMLTGAGIAKLRAEGLARDLDWIDFDTAHEARAKADYAAGTLRLSVAACEARGASLPPDTPKLP